MCPREELVAAYLARQLSREERDDFEAHVDGCAMCSSVIAVLARATPASVRSRDESSLLDSLEPIGANDLDIASWHPGATVGRFVILDALGSGGMGAVYAAYDPELDRRVAIKVLHDNGTDRRLKAEARAIARLTHPNVVGVHDVGDADGRLFIAMEFVDGETLREWLQQPQSTAAILNICVQAGRGIAAAHEAGLVHRDVKPSNIIVGRDGRARVVDFGLALAGGRGDGVGAGTPAYMPPEQRAGGEVDARADQYAFCVTVDEAVAGANGVVERAQRALRRGRATDPAERWPSMSALLDELAPPVARGRRRIVGAFVVGGVMAAVFALAVVRRNATTPPCGTAGSAIDVVWNDGARSALRAAFVGTGGSFAPRAAEDAVARLDGWTKRWQTSAIDGCRAAVVERRQSPASHELRQACLDGLLTRLTPLVARTAAPTAELIANAGTITSELPAPERCDNVAALGVISPPAEAARAEVADVEQALAAAETDRLAGQSTTLVPAVAALRTRADDTQHAPIQARARLLAARLDMDLGNYDAATMGLHSAAAAAAGAHDYDLLAAVWIDLTATLGNDLRTSDQAATFDGYVTALLPSTSDPAAGQLALAMARCNRNTGSGASDGATIAQYCTTAITLADARTPPDVGRAVTARIRLGHFQRVTGQAEAALQTLRDAVELGERSLGPMHPDVGLARYVLGIAYLARNEMPAAFAELERALVIRRAAFPNANAHVVESLQGLGDARAVNGEHEVAVTLFEQALVIVDKLGQPDGMQAAHLHLLLGMSLQDLGRDADAVTHFLRGADIFDRALAHNEERAAMGLQLAAAVVEATSPATAIAYLERGLRLLERGKAPALKLGHGQRALAKLLAVAPTRADRERARGLANAALGNYLLAGQAGALHAADLQSWLAAQRF